MNQHAKVDIRHSTCPHDCPSACALDVEVIEGKSIGRVRGSKLQTYTAGVVCAKVARYAERIHHPDRLLYPMRRTGPKGSGQFARISWDEALDEIAARFDQAEREFGAQSVWPYYYAGTMGLVMRDGINRLSHVKKYSRFYSTICANIARVGFSIGTGKIAGVDPREMGVSDLVVIWGTNPVNTQVNVMTHAMRARKERGAKIAAVDIYNNDTMKQADIKIILRPGTDGAFACGVMHVLFREGFADRAYMERYTDCPAELEAHLATRTPERAALATAIAKRDKVADYLHRVAAALPAAWDDVAAAEKLAADWEEALRDAKEDEPKRTTLSMLRQTILAALPEAEQGISYGAPAFKVRGKTIVGFAAFNNHLSYLPHSGSVFPELAEELRAYQTSSGALRFPIDEPLPRAIVEKLIAYAA